MPSIKQEIRKFILDNFLFGDKNGFADNDSFLEKGIIDSTGMLELVTFVQQRHGITIEDEELIPDNLDSVNRIASYLAKKLDHSASIPSPAEELSRLNAV